MASGYWHSRGSDVRLLSRNRLPQNDAYPDVVRAVAELPVHDLVLDGEATGHWGKSSETGYHVFDILWHDGRVVASLPLEERRALLERLPLRPPLLRVAALDDPKPWERACAEGWEGVIAKRRGSTYEHRRSPHWLKMKCELAQELVVGGFTDPQGRARRPRRAARRLLRRRRAGLRGKDRHRLRHQAAARAARAARRAGDREHAVHQSRRAAAPARPLGAARDRRAGRLHRVDRQQQAASPAAARRPHRQAGARGRQRDVADSTATV